MPESTASSLLRPYYGLARLLAATAKWQALTDSATEDDALATISFPDYRVIDEGSLVRVPLIVIANPLDLGQTLFKQNDREGRKGFGSLLITFVMRGDDEIETPRERLQQFIDDVGVVCDQALVLSAELHPDGDKYYQNVEHFELAIAGGECDLRALAGVDRDNDDDDPDPQVVMSCSLVAHWI